MILPDNKPCPSCRATGGDKTGDHLYRVRHPATKDKLNFYKCRKCGHVETIAGAPVDIPEPAKVYGANKREIENYPFVQDRGIKAKVRQLYGVRTSISPIGDLERHWYPITKDGVVLTYKYRTIVSKDFGRITKGVSGDIDLFGMLSLKGTPRQVLITEGEEDAMAAHQMLEGYVVNIGCLSLPDGATNMQALTEALPWLAKADRVYFCPDQDAAGLEAVERIAKLLPEIFVLKDLGEKDANAMLLKGKTEHFRNCYLRAKKYAPSFLVEVADVLADVLKVPEYGRSYPWPTLHKLTFGMRDGEGIYVGAGVKIGKSEFINELVLHRIQAKDGDIPAIIKFEEMPFMTVKKLSGKMDKTFYHRPDIPVDMKQLKATSESLDKRMFLYKAFGQGTWDIVANYIRYVAARGSKTIIIDPITKLTNHLNPSDTETELRRISDELACMAHDLGFFYVVTCHLKAPPSAKVPHERGGRVESNQFRGSRAMMENCYYMLGIERNKDPDLTEEERNTSTFVLLDDRAFGNTGRFKVFYNSKTGEYTEPPILHT